MHQVVEASNSVPPTQFVQAGRLTPVVLSVVQSPSVVELPVLEIRTFQAVQLKVLVQRLTPLELLLDLAKQLTTEKSAQTSTLLAASSH
jgi:hypothetical protein